LEFPLALTRTDTTLSFLPRLWAHQKVQALEAQIDRFGATEELLDDILDLGLTYRLVTRRTSLFAPDESVIVNPQIADTQVERGNGNAQPTAVEETRTTATWLGKQFYLQDEVWVDVLYQPHMDTELYRDRAGQPAVLRDFARLGQRMVVVVDDLAYTLDPGSLPRTPVLSQNRPNPFNASTLISLHIPVGLESVAMRLAIYDLLGQRVREFSLEALHIGENEVIWDGTDSRGHAVATGIYIYRLEGREVGISRRMLLLR